MSRIEPSRVIFYLLLTALLFGATFAFGMYSAAQRTPLYGAVTQAFSQLRDTVALAREESETITRVKPVNYLQLSRRPGSGITVNSFPDDNTDFVLVSGFYDDNNELRLMRRSGEVVQRWPVKFNEIFEDSSFLKYPPATEWNIDTHGALAMPDGGVVFNFEYGGMVRLDRCGEIVWTVKRNTHHSVERAADGGFWAVGRRHHDVEEGIGQDGTSDLDSPFPPFQRPFDEDTLLKVSSQGDVLAEISVPGIFFDSGLEALLTGTGHDLGPGVQWDHEIVHVNKVEPLEPGIADAFANFEAGDLAVSIRSMNLVMVVRPDVDAQTAQAVWWNVGPWLRQHDPEFTERGTLLVFNNNTYKDALLGGSNQLAGAPRRTSNIIEIDPETDEFRVIYGDQPDQPLLTVIRGKHEVTHTGSLLITEFEGGRVLEVNSDGETLWEYIHRYSEDEVFEITEARVYPETYFTVPNWHCTASLGAKQES